MIPNKGAHNHNQHSVPPYQVPDPDSRQTVFPHPPPPNMWSGSGFVPIYPHVPPSVPHHIPQSVPHHMPQSAPHHIPQSAPHHIPQSVPNAGTSGRAVLGPPPAPFPGPCHPMPYDFISSPNPMPHFAPSMATANGQPFFPHLKLPSVPPPSFPHNTSLFVPDLKEQMEASGRAALYGGDLTLGTAAAKAAKNGVTLEAPRPSTPSSHLQGSVSQSGIGHSMGATGEPGGDSMFQGGGSRKGSFSSAYMQAHRSNEKLAMKAVQSACSSPSSTRSLSPALSWKDSCAVSLPDRCTADVQPVGVKLGLSPLAMCSGLYQERLSSQMCAIDVSPYGRVKRPLEIRTPDELSKSLDPSAKEFTPTPRTMFSSSASETDSASGDAKEETLNRNNSACVLEGLDSVFIDNLNTNNSGNIASAQAVSGFIMSEDKCSGHGMDGNEDAKSSDGRKSEPSGWSTWNKEKLGKKGSVCREEDWCEEAMPSPSKARSQRDKASQTGGLSLPQKKKHGDHPTSRKVLDLQAEVCELRAHLCLSELQRERFQLELDLFWWRANFQPLTPSPISPTMTATENRLHSIMMQMHQIETERDQCLSVIHSGKELDHVPHFAICLGSGEYVLPACTVGKSGVPFTPNSTGGSTSSAGLSSARPSSHLSSRRSSAADSTASDKKHHQDPTEPSRKRLCTSDKLSASCEPLLSANCDQLPDKLPAICDQLPDKLSAICDQLPDKLSAGCDQLSANLESLALGDVGSKQSSLLSARNLSVDKAGTALSVDGCTKTEKSSRQESNQKTVDNEETSEGVTVDKNVVERETSAITKLDNTETVECAEKSDDANEDAEHSCKINDPKTNTEFSDVPECGSELVDVKQNIEASEESELDRLLEMKSTASSGNDSFVDASESPYKEGFVVRDRKKNDEKNDEEDDLPQNSEQDGVDKSEGKESATVGLEASETPKEGSVTVTLRTDDTASFGDNNAAEGDANASFGEKDHQLSSESVVLRQSSLDSNSSGYLSGENLKDSPKCEQTGKELCETLHSDLSVKSTSVEVRENVSGVDAENGQSEAMLEPVQNEKDGGEMKKDGDTTAQSSDQSAATLTCHRASAKAKNDEVKADQKTSASDGDVDTVTSNIKSKCTENVKEKKRISVANKNADLISTKSDNTDSDTKPETLKVESPLPECAYSESSLDKKPGTDVAQTVDNDKTKCDENLSNRAAEEERVVTSTEQSEDPKSKQAKKASVSKKESKSTSSKITEEKMKTQMGEVDLFGIEVDSDDDQLVSIDSYGYNDEDLRNHSDAFCYDDGSFGHVYSVFQDVVRQEKMSASSEKDSKMSASSEKDSKMSASLEKDSKMSASSVKDVKMTTSSAKDVKMSASSAKDVKMSASSAKDLKMSEKDSESTVEVSEPTVEASEPEVDVNRADGCVDSDLDDVDCVFHDEIQMDENSPDAEEGRAVDYETELSTGVVLDDNNTTDAVLDFNSADTVLDNNSTDTVLDKNYALKVRKERESVDKDSKAPCMDKQKGEGREVAVAAVTAMSGGRVDGSGEGASALDKNAAPKVETNWTAVLKSITDKLRDLYPAESKDSVWLQKTAEEQTRLFLDALDKDAASSESCMADANSTTETRYTEDRTWPGLEPSQLETVEGPALSTHSVTSAMCGSVPAACFQYNAGSAISQQVTGIGAAASTQNQMVSCVQPGPPTQPADNVLAKQEELSACRRLAVTRQNQALERAASIQQTLVALNEQILQYPDDEELTRHVEVTLRQYQLLLDEAEKQGRLVATYDQQLRALHFTLYQRQQLSLFAMPPNVFSMPLSATAPGNSVNPAANKGNPLSFVPATAFVPSSSYQASQQAYPQFWQPRPSVAQKIPSLLSLTTYPPNFPAPVFSSSLPPQSVSTPSVNFSVPSSTSFVPSSSELPPVPSRDVMTAAAQTSVGQPVPTSWSGPPLSMPSKPVLGSSSSAFPTSSVLSTSVMPATFHGVSATAGSTASAFRPVLSSAGGSGAATTLTTSEAASPVAFSVPKLAGVVPSKMSSLSSWTTPSALSKTSEPASNTTLKRTRDDASPERPSFGTTGPSDAGRPPSPPAFRPLLPLKPIKISNNRYAALASTSLSSKNEKEKGEQLPRDDSSLQDVEEEKEKETKKPCLLGKMGLDDFTLAPEMSTKPKAVSPEKAWDFPRSKQDQAWQTSKKGAEKKKRSGKRQRSGSRRRNSSGNSTSGSGGCTSKQQQQQQQFKAKEEEDWESNMLPFPKWRVGVPAQNLLLPWSPPDNENSEEENMGKDNASKMASSKKGEDSDGSRRSTPTPRRQIDTGFLGQLVRNNEVANVVDKTKKRTSSSSSSRSNTSSPTTSDKPEPSESVDEWKKVWKGSRGNGGARPKQPAADSRTGFEPKDPQPAGKGSSKLSSYQLLCQSVQQEFPTMKMDDIREVIDEVRKSRHGGHFKGILYSDILKEVKTVIMQKFASSLRAPQATMPVFTKMNQNAAAERKTDKKSEAVWHQAGGGSDKQFMASDDECSICLIDLAPYNSFQLDCGHTFHRQCIDMWVKKQGERTCPNCRRMVLLTDEFPHLGGDHRGQGQAWPSRAAVPMPMAPVVVTLPPPRLTDLDFPRLGT